MTEFSDQITGQFKATKIWNELLDEFKEGMKLERKRRMFKTYEHCFTGYQAAKWTQNYLISHALFSDNITRRQVLMLLQKVMDYNIFEDVEKKSKVFQSNSSLYQFTDKITSTSETDAENNNFNEMLKREKTKFKKLLKANRDTMFRSVRVRKTSSPLIRIHEPDENKLITNRLRPKSYCKQSRNSNRYISFYESEPLMRCKSVSTSRITGLTSVSDFQLLDVPSRQDILTTCSVPELSRQLDGVVLDSLENDDVFREQFELQL